MKIIKKLLIILPIICGIVLFAVIKMSRKPPERLEGRERVRSVRIIPMEKMDVIPRVKGYGYVKAGKTWQAISEVSGEVVSINENLKKGHFIKKGALLIKIDTESYGLAESRGVADIMNVDAKLRELDQSQKNTQRLLAIEKKSLDIAAQELKRKKALFKNGYISKSDLEKEETRYLSRKTSVRNLQNTLNLIPARKKSLLAQKKSGESTVSQQRLDVAKTEIRAPFNGRLSAVNIELHQFAVAGSVLIEAESVDKAEIPVALTPKNFMAILQGTYGVKLNEIPDIETIRNAIGITAKVRLPIDTNQKVEWDGRFSRTSESMDLKTGAITIYVEVDQPYEKAIPGVRPPLVTNMYVEVELSGRKIKDKFVVPRSSIHVGKVYICNKENRLELRPVNVDLHMLDIAVIRDGFHSGDTLVLTDLAPAIQGMLLNPVTDVQTLKMLRQIAAGVEKAK